MPVSKIPSVGTGTVVIKATRKGNFMDESLIRNLITDALEETSKEAMDNLHLITATWKEHNPQFIKTRVRISDDATQEILTNDEIFYYLNKGTRVRYAVMSSDFRPKTSHRNYRSGAGAGDPHPTRFIKKGSQIRSQQHKEGIKAREWTDQLAKDMSPVLAIKVNQKFKTLVKTS